ncbi:MAG TPA: hypothetical protein VL335_02225 [Candidatus Paceibacterota bacterium]|nr:hypothetical protein [Candidatus Paceibacterota bacterium]
MPPSEDQNRIEELKKSLYSRSAPEVRTRRKLRFSDTNTDIKSEWAEPAEKIQEPARLNTEYEDHSMSFFTKFLIGSGIFCVIAVSIGLYLFLNGANLISGDNINVTISGPVSIPGGEPVKFGIKVTNNNNIDLQLVDMNVAFPAGATDPNDSSQTLNSLDQYLGDIPTGYSTSTAVSAIIFGEENTQKTITATLTYKVKGSSALFTKVATYQVLINSSPISLSVNSFTSITSGQEFDMTVKLKSNSQDVLKNVILKGQYPFGYTFLSANIQPLSDNATWKIGDIPPGGERSVVVHGKLQGENDDTRVFNFSVGARSASNSAVIATQYGLVSQSITIEKSFISLKIGIDNDTSSSDYVGHFGSPTRVTVTWFNNLSVAVTNANITVNLAGNAYDKTKIQPDLGYFDSAHNQIVWNQQTNPELASLGAGDSGSVSFSITPTNILNASGNQPIDPSVSLTANVSADRTQESGVSGTISAAVSRVVKVASNVALSGRIVRTVGPFTNTGPIPPKAEQKTTYTVLWSIGNTTSSVSNAQVTATLPPYVTWMGSVSPSNEDITFDQNTGAITWNVGSVSAYSTNPSKRREVAFQIGFTPSITQVSMSPTLINQATLTATDDFTQAQLTSQQDYLSSSFSTDPAFKGGDETVIQ